jgi:hypothetical protein
MGGTVRALAAELLHCLLRSRGKQRPRCPPLGGGEATARERQIDPVLRISNLLDSFPIRRHDGATACKPRP